ncbi:hypothetical protein FH972_006225 [Carpinus fangiana]|uniref:RNase H type-1 domain-containing protein n=1 Tax=Carpinus fangiana TaxID=176857 RepID=A0A5N6QV55_9ROSI|nr:hypothetical protein FH972_006225 [Carpinus fangiana]
MDPLSAETWAGVQAAKFGVELQITHLYLEGDAQGVVKAVNTEADIWSKVGHLVDDLKSVLNGVPQWKVLSVGRGANGVAHTIAQKAAWEGLNKTWLGESSPKPHAFTQTHRIRPTSSRHPPQSPASAPPPHSSAKALLLQSWVSRIGEEGASPNNGFHRTMGLAVEEQCVGGGGEDAGEDVGRILWVWVKTWGFG